MKEKHCVCQSREPGSRVLVQVPEPRFLEIHSRLKVPLALLP
jgi:hypothetical protein